MVNDELHKLQMNMSSSKVHDQMSTLAQNHQLELGNEALPYFLSPMGCGRNNQNSLKISSLIS